MLIPGSWRPSGKADPEYALTTEEVGRQRVLILPALFDEANKLRQLAADTMRRMAHDGLASLLPDLPGTNESLALLNAQSLGNWRAQVADLVTEYRPQSILAFRGGALLAPAATPCWVLGPVSGATILRGFLRARVIADRELGQHNDRDALLEVGREEGLAFAGYAISARMVRELEAATVPDHAQPIAQADLGGAGLWLRAEPDHDAAQSQRLAQFIRDRLS